MICMLSTQDLSQGSDACMPWQVRLLQGRFEAADMESKELQDKLKIAHATNARLAAELEEASSLLLKYSEKKDTGREVEDMYRRRLAAAEQELHKAEYTFQVNVWLSFCSDCWHGKTFFCVYVLFVRGLYTRSI
jgi:hypothetical protein